MSWSVTARCEQCDARITVEHVTVEQPRTDPEVSVFAFRAILRRHALDVHPLTTDAVQ